MEFDFQQIVTLMGGIGGTIVGAAFFFRTIVAKWVDSGTSIEEANARRDVVTLLRDQMEELVNLNRELREEKEFFRTENEALHALIAELRDKVYSLESRIDKLLNKE